jgi:hypothetical protein
MPTPAKCEASRQRAEGGRKLTLAARGAGRTGQRQCAANFLTQRRGERRDSQSLALSAFLCTAIRQNRSIHSRFLSTRSHVLPPSPALAGYGGQVGHPLPSDGRGKG